MDPILLIEEMVGQQSMQVRSGPQRYLSNFTGMDVRAECRRNDDCQNSRKMVHFIFSPDQLALFIIREAATEHIGLKGKKYGTKGLGASRP
jgi:hypothetical protein